MTLSCRGEGGYLRAIVLFFKRSTSGVCVTFTVVACVLVMQLFLGISFVALFFKTLWRCVSMNCIKYQLNTRSFFLARAV